MGMVWMAVFMVTGAATLYYKLEDAAAEAERAKAASMKQQPEKKLSETNTQSAAVAQEKPKEEKSEAPAAQAVNEENQQQDKKEQILNDKRQAKKEVLTGMTEQSASKEVEGKEDEAETGAADTQVNGEPVKQLTEESKDDSQAFAAESQTQKDGRESKTDVAK